MSVAHPIIAVMGSSDAGTSTVKNAFEDIFRRMELAMEVILAPFVEEIMNKKCQYH
jgi:phosphoribulokinase